MRDDPRIAGHTPVAVYQPIVQAGTTIAVEALLRIRRPDGALALPYELLDDHANLPEITSWMISEAATASDQLGFPVHVNVPPTLVEAFAFNLPDGIELEITEEPTNLETLQRSIRRAAAAGARLWLDDIGAGEGALRRLAHAEGIAGIKLDGSLLALAHTSWGVQVIGAFVEQAADLGVKVVAERVETRADVTAATQLGVSLMQGWYFGMAQPLDAITSPAARQPVRIRAI